MKMPANGNHPLKLQFGLVNHEGRYLTAETFGFKVKINPSKMLTDVLIVPPSTCVPGERLSARSKKAAKMDS